VALETIAACAGVGIGTLYRHFRSRRRTDANSHYLRDTFGICRRTAMQTRKESHHVQWSSWERIAVY
jgi:hypothetical protein